jgi:hypothetical protein
MKKILCAALAVWITASPALGQHRHGSQTPYAGLQSRAIKSLSDNDIKELRRGGGWGLALAAELNGMPGPAHLLELKDQIPLTQDQVVKTQALLDDMRKAAIPTGERLIAAETALEHAFAKGVVDEACLQRPSLPGPNFASFICLNTSRRCSTSSPNRSIATTFFADTPRTPAKTSPQGTTPKCIDDTWDASDRFWPQQNHPTRNTEPSSSLPRGGLTATSAAAPSVKPTLGFTGTW